MSSFGSTTVTLWFASAHLVSSIDERAKWFEKISFAQRLLNNPWQEIKRLTNLGARQISSATPRQKRFKRYRYVMESVALAVRRLQDLESTCKTDFRVSSFCNDQISIDAPISASSIMSQESFDDINRLRALQAKYLVRTHFKAIRDICFSPDHKWFVTAGLDQTAVMIRMPVSHIDNPNSQQNSYWYPKPYESPLSHEDIKVLPHPGDTVREVRWWVTIRTLHIFWRFNLALRSPSGKCVVVRLRQGYKIWSNVSGQLFCCKAPLSLEPGVERKVRTDYRSKAGHIFFSLVGWRRRSAWSWLPTSGPTQTYHYIYSIFFSWGAWSS